MSSVRLQLFGQVQVWVDEKPLPRLRTRKGYLLLALLALRGGAPVSRDWLIGTLWPESDQEAGAMSLRRALHDLRAALGEAEGVIESPDKRHLRFNPTETSVDALEFPIYHAQFERTGELADGESAAKLYQGVLLSEFDDEAIVAERQRFQQQAQALLMALTESALRAGFGEKAVALAQRAEKLDPLHEKTQQILYQALALSGDPAGARLAYREFRMRLYQELRQEPSAETKRCLENLPTRAPRQAPSTPLAIKVPSLDTLPVFLSAFLGRDAELRQLEKCLQKNRLTTLLGPGGVGKTRLAIEAARQSVGHFPDGVFFLDLTTLPADSSQDALWIVLAQTVCEEKAAPHESPQEQVCAWLRTRNILLVLDNAEHMRGTVASVTGTILRAAPALHVLATSRVPLGLPGEQLQPLAPLPLPDSDSLSTLLESDAARFFVQRAQALLPHFELTPQSAPDIALICRRLDGLPLALELAAARLRLLSLPDLARRLAASLDLLTGSDQLSERQRTLENLIDWSYSPLPTSSQRLFRRLALLPDTFSLETVEWLGQESAALDALSQLVDASLIQVSEDNAGATRYRLLETIRAFGRKRLEQSEDQDAACERLASWGVEFLTRAYDGLWGAEGGLWLRRISLELPNLGKALEVGTGETALPMAHLLEQFWWRTNRFQEGIAWFSVALSKPGGSAEERLSCELGREQFRHFRGEPSTILETLRRAIATYTEVGNLIATFYCQHTLAILLSKEGLHQEAEGRIRASLAIAEHQVKDREFYLAYAELGLLEILQRAGQSASARAYGEAALRRFLALGREAHVVQVRLQLGRALLALGNISEAKTTFEAGLQGAQSGEMRDQELEFLLALGDIAQQHQDTPTARRYYEKVLQIAHQGGQEAPVLLAQEALKSLP